MIRMRRENMESKLFRFSRDVADGLNADPPTKESSFKIIDGSDRPTTKSTNDIKDATIGYLLDLAKTKNELVIEWEIVDVKYDADEVAVSMF